MAEDLELDLGDDSQPEEHPIDKRIEKLSEKVKLTSKERDDLDRLNKEKDAEIANLKKDIDFRNSFGTVLTKYPDVSTHQDKVKELVSKGYSIDDAAVSVLIAEGKYTPPKRETTSNMSSPAGGSAPIQPITGGEKSVSDMTRDEKRAKLLEAEQRGDLGLS